MLAYGTAALAFVALLPIEFALLVFAAERDDAAAYFMVYDAWLVLPAVLLLVWLYASVRWPMRLRATWPHFGRPRDAP